jgi:hypothetical protein
MSRYLIVTKGHLAERLAAKKNEMERSGVVGVGVKWGCLSEESNLQPVD